MIYHPNGTVTLPASADPAIQRVTGSETFWLAADLGQANDYSALVIIRSRILPVWASPQRQALAPEERVVVYADRFRGVSYVDVVSHFIGLMNKPGLAGKTQLCIDGTSIGRVVSDLLHDRNVPHHAIQMTAGQEWSRKGRYVNVAKTLMIETLSVMFAGGDLTFASDLPLRREIEEDLATFSLQTTAAGNQIITQSRSAAGHGDLGIALALGAFASQHLRQGVVETIKVGNYW